MSRSHRNESEDFLAFFNDREIRAVWDEAGNQWWFALVIQFRKDDDRRSVCGWFDIEDESEEM